MPLLSTKLVVDLAIWMQPESQEVIVTKGESDIWCKLLILHIFKHKEGQEGSNLASFFFFNGYAHKIT